MKNRKRGFTLVEIVITMAILLIASLGVINYQYYAIKSAKIAQTKISATRLGTLILENWKSFGGSDTYDPTALKLGVVKLTSVANKYLITVDDVPFYLTLSARDIDSSEITGVTLRELSVFVQWNSNYSQGIPQNSAPSTTFYTYVRQDQSGG